VVTFGARRKSFGVNACACACAWRWLRITLRVAHVAAMLRQCYGTFWLISADVTLLRIWVTSLHATCGCVARGFRNGSWVGQVVTRLIGKPGTPTVAFEATRIAAFRFSDRMFGWETGLALRDYCSRMRMYRRAEFSSPTFHAFAFVKPTFRLREAAIR